jgi:citrate synthase
LATADDLRGAIALRLQREAAARWREIAGHSDIGPRQKRTEHTPGFGHTLYRGGDPRAAWLLERLAEQSSGAESKFVLSVANLVTEMTGQHPNIDFALAALARAARLPAGAPLAIFTVGRPAGWIGHTLEQYADGNLIRPRARYTGIAPATIAP